MHKTREVKSKVAVREVLGRGKSEKRTSVDPVTVHVRG